MLQLYAIIQNMKLIGTSLIRIAIERIAIEFATAATAMRLVWCGVYDHIIGFPPYQEKHQVEFHALAHGGVLQPPGGYG